MAKKYTHIVSVAERHEAHVVQIHRAMDDRLDLYSEIELPSVSAGEVDWGAFERISAWLGKAICIDSPELRCCFGIEAAAHEGTATAEGDGPTMGASFQMQAFIDRDGVLEPFLLSISAPVRSNDAKEFHCEVHAPALLSRDAEVFGVDAVQAQALAAKLIKAMLGKAKLVDHDHRPVDW